MIVSGGKVIAIDKVWHDETLSGDGQTKDSKLGVVGGGKGLVTSGAISAKEGCFGLTRNGWVSVPTTADFHNVWTKVEQIETSAKVWNTIPGFNKTDDKVYGLSKNGWTEISVDPGIVKVWHNGTLSGDGTSASPLGVIEVPSAAVRFLTLSAELSQSTKFGGRKIKWKIVSKKGMTSADLMDLKGDYVVDTSVITMIPSGNNFDDYITYTLKVGNKEYVYDVDRTNDNIQHESFNDIFSDPGSFNTTIVSDETAVANISAYQNIYSLVSESVSGGTNYAAGPGIDIYEEDGIKSISSFNSFVFDEKGLISLEFQK